VTVTLIEIAERLKDKYDAAHYACDMKQDTDCGAEEYGDGNAGEHEDYRAVEIAIAEAKAPGYDTVHVKGGRAWGATRAMDIVDFDVEGSDPDDLCSEADCSEEEDHYHYCEG
jgi:hypothetical protein